MILPFLILSTLLLAGLPAAFQDAQQPAAPAPAAQAAPAPPAATPAPTPFTVPVAAANLPNPVQPTAQSQTRAKQIYSMDCAMCHAADGSGKGDITGTAKMLDYRDASALKGLTDGQVFYIIKNGEGENMPGEGPRANDVETWNLVIYLRSFSKTQAAAGHGPA